MTPDQAVASDAKLYEENGHRFNVAQIEELSFANFHDKREALLEALEKRRLQQSLLFSALLVTDVNEQNSLLLLRGSDAFLRTIDYAEHSTYTWDLPGVVSRKKQLLPYLLRCLSRMRS
jgi:manganese-dependent inorganic pyrophosphatase